MICHVISYVLVYAAALERTSLDIAWGELVHTSLGVQWGAQGTCQLPVGAMQTPAGGVLGTCDAHVKVVGATVAPHKNRRAIWPPAKVGRFAHDTVEIIRTSGSHMEVIGTESPLP